MRAAQLADQLAHEISQAAPGTRLASESDLMARFGVGRSIVRAALSFLESRFLVRRVRGSGTFVARRADFVLTGAEPPSFHSVVSTSGSELRTQLVAARRLPVTGPFDAMLGIGPGTPATRINRRGTIDGFEASYSEEWLAPDVVEDVDAGLGVIESVYEILVAYGYRPRRARTSVTVDDPPAEVARMLAYDTVRTAWLVETLTRDAATGSLLMASQTWLRLDSVRLVVEMGEHLSDN